MYVLYTRWSNDLVKPGNPWKWAEQYRWLWRGGHLSAVVCMYLEMFNYLYQQLGLQYHKFVWNQIDVCAYDIDRAFFADLEVMVATLTRKFKTTV